ncbi:exodeoxyribonuclease VII large subunit [Actinospica durhamensis]|uniref:Exodeoxyribonuclease 7 large subunit n=1 Tax=Actinospica durhamensis TaxID=1508375 RepID=A0A941EMS9_9ACTN|nr:exodeoxyribonuclease VII large subunit [Actinospica durhamensis]MBR7835295.1 exodeoxyribonuclease VII large subunit [Actinospica durhamensis]
MALDSSFDKPVPVATVATLVGDWIDRLGVIHVEGQITQINRRPGAGVVFLTLRDPAQDVSVSITCFRQVFEQIVPPPAEGQRVVLRAKPAFYRGRAQFSLQMFELRQVGLGELLARIEQLKAKLAAQGLFDPGRKQRLPFLPQLIGLITGRASAAEKDVLENTRRRWPGVRFEVREVAVQGATAVPQITAALAELDGHPEVDVIVIARGGGSVEDLLPFSDEQLLRAVAACRTPVVSAIGHEPDSPLLDLVADLRASTPTDAAKRLVPDVREELERVRQARERMRAAIVRTLDREERALANYRSRPVLAAPHSMLERREQELADARARARRALHHRLARDTEVLAQTLARVRALSPLKTLERGYAIVQSAEGHVLRDAAQVTAGQELGVRLAAGRLAVKVGAVSETGGPAGIGPSDAGGASGGPEVGDVDDVVAVDEVDTVGGVDGAAGVDV